MSLKGLWAEFKAFAFQGNMIELAVAVVIGAAFSTVINSLVNDVIMPTVGYVVNTASTAAEKAKDVAETAASKAGIASSQPAAEAAAAAPATAVPPAAAAATAVPPAADAGGNVAPSEAKLIADLKVAVAELVAADAKATADAKAAADAAAAKKAPVKINLMLGPINAGAFIGAMINFLLVAAAVFFCIVKLLGTVMKKVRKPAEPSAPVTKECPHCLTIIPIKATKCPACTADLPAMAT